MKEIFKNCNLFVDGHGYAGQVTELTPPKLEIKTEDFKAGGMDGSVPIDMGMEKLEASFKLISFTKEMLTLWGLKQGGFVPFTIKGALENQTGEIIPLNMKLRGKIKTLDFGNFTAGEKAELSINIDVVYYELSHNNEVIHEIDIENTVRIINGIDQLEQTRSALGV